MDYQDLYAYTLIEGIHISPESLFKLYHHYTVIISRKNISLLFADIYFFNMANLAFNSQPINAFAGKLPLPLLISMVPKSASFLPI